jgi:hypothetical protein
MSDILIGIHIVFIIALVVSSWYSGFKIGRKNMIEQMIDDEVVTVSDLIKLYKPKD